MGFVVDVLVDVGLVEFVPNVDESGRSHPPTILPGNVVEILLLAFLISENVGTEIPLELSVLVSLYLVAFDLLLFIFF